ncbi:MAG: HD domain-containing protein [Actinobacteria bacterium]|nr:MAG: HD domain-containing protein [Actinomycetota bacterium]
MPARKLIKHLFWSAEVVLLAGTVVLGALLSHADEWHPMSLLALLIGLAAGGEWFTVETSAGVLSSSLGVMTLAMGLLGPGPAALCGVTAIGVNSAVRGRPLSTWLNNFVVFGVAAFVAGLIVRALAGDVAGMDHHSASESVVFGLILLAGAFVLLVVNFVLFVPELLVRDGRRPKRAVRELFLPTLPSELSVGVIAIVLAIAYRAIGMPALFAAIPVLLIFRHLTVALMRSEQRAEQLDRRTRQLASFQWAVPSTFMEGLGLRDPTALRHGAAVASYAKALAIEVGCDEEEQEAIHLTGLLHDIGKFTWSDRILHPEQLTDADWAVIRRHPQDGAMMVGKFDGFGPVADGILYHHERMDGTGYPAGLIGSEIPLASRIVAVCSIYDTMTKRETYGPPMPPEEAIAELRRIAGAQLDATLVETFIALLERKGLTFGQEADYRTELSFENRVRKMAQPQSDAGRSPVAMRLRQRD